MAFVYLLLDGEDTPFYVGVGSERKGRGPAGHRPYDHAREAVYRNKRRSVHVRLNAMILAGGLGDLTVMEIAHGWTGADAKRLEAALVEAIGRHPYGPLANETAGGNSPADVHWNSGKTMPAAVRAKISLTLSGRARGPYPPERVARTRLGLIGRKCGPPSEARRLQIAEDTRISWLDPEVRARRENGMVGRNLKSEVTKDRMRSAALANVTPEFRARMVLHGKATAGTRWIHNNLVSSKIGPDEALPEGWMLGRCKRRKKQQL